MNKQKRSIAAILALILFVTFSIQGVDAATKQKEFYLRYITPQQIAVMDNEAKKTGSKYYFDLLKSKDMYDQYFAINKLVEYYNKDAIRKKAITAIKPFLKSSQPKIKEAATFSLDILEKKFKSKNIVHLENGQKIFTLFNNYSDYGSFNEILTIKNDKISVYEEFHAPHMYITNMIASPDKKYVAITMVSNKSSYLIVRNNQRTSPELVETTRIIVAKDLKYNLTVRTDYENYCGVSYVEWLDNDTLRFNATLSYNDTQIINMVAANYNCKTKEIKYDLAVN